VIAERVWAGKKSGSLIKVSSAVAEVAQELRCSETTVWNAWKEFDPIEYKRWKREDKNERWLDAARETREESL